MTEACPSNNNYPRLFFMGYFRLVNLTFKLYPLENHVKIKVQFESSAPLTIKTS